MLTMRDLIPWSRGRDVVAGRASEHPLVAFQREFERLFEEMWTGFDAPLRGRGERAVTSITPRIEVHENETEIVVTTELPGLQEKDVDITLTDNVLSIRGEKKLDKTGKEEGHTYSERSYGLFERRIPIEAEIVADKVAARFADGVLTVTLPKHPEAKPHVQHIRIGGQPEAEAPKAA